MDSRGSTSGNSKRWAWWLYFVAAGVATAIGGFLLNTKQLSNDQLNTANIEMRRHRLPQYNPNLWAWGQFDDAPCEQLRNDSHQCEEDYLAYKQEKEECTRLFDALNACSAPYRNLYRLFNNNGEQGFLERDERDFLKRHGRPRRMALPPVVDWKPYLQFFQEHGASFSQTLPNMIFARDTPLWKKLPNNTEPKLILLEIDVPSTACRCMEEQVEEIEENDMVGADGKIYVVDQNGRVLGWREFAPCRLGRWEECANGSLPASANFFEAVGGKVELYLLPGDTQSIQFKLFSTLFRWRPGQGYLLGNAPTTCFCETEVLPVPVIQ